MHKELDIGIYAISMEEIMSAVKEIKNGKAPRNDNIPTELLKAGTTMVVNKLHHTFLSIWDTRES